MNIHSKVTFAQALCAIVEFAGLGFFVSMQNVTPPFIPLAWTIIAISGFACLIQTILIEEINVGKAILGGGIGIGVILISASNLILK